MIRKTAPRNPPGSRLRSGEFFERGVNVADHVQRAVAQNHAVFTRMLDGKLHAVFDDAASRHGLSEAAQVGGKIGCLHGAGMVMNSLA